jgi:hypothetical protein
MTDNPERDPLADLLAAPGPVDTGELRHSLLAETTRQLPRPRRLRFVVLAAALAACYVAGLLTMYLLRPAAPPPVTVPSEPQPESVAEKPADPPAVVPQPADLPDRSQQAARLRQDGDRQLTEKNDPESALQSYTKALNVGTEDDAKFSPDDNWLLMAIKNAREKEARNANSE